MNRFAACPKCGCDKVSFRYCRGHGYLVTRSWMPCPREEHMHRDCPACGYGWTKPCGDAVTEKIYGLGQEEG